MATSREPPQCRCALAVAVIAMLGGGLATSAAADQDASPDVSDTATPIKHLVVVVGENRSFDHIYGLCHGNSIEHAVRAETRHASCRCDGTSPLCGSFCSEDPQCRSRDEVALQVEGVVNRSVDAEEALG